MTAMKKLMERGLVDQRIWKRRRLPRRTTFKRSPRPLNSPATKMFRARTHLRPALSVRAFKRQPRVSRSDDKAADKHVQ
jgi:hypothetical protein